MADISWDIREKTSCILYIGQAIDEVFIILHV